MAGGFPLGLEPDYFFSMYSTPGRFLKCSSCVHRVALWVRAVARMMLSASGSLCSNDNRAACKAISSLNAANCPRYNMPIACSADSIPRWIQSRLNTSNIQIVGTTRLGSSVRAGAKKSALLPSAKYSNHPLESTTFILDPLLRGQPRCQFQGTCLALAKPVAQRLFAAYSQK